MDKEKDKAVANARDVHSAVKVIDMVKGAAAGGLYGAALYAAGSAKKWLAGLTVILMLPAVILALLPTIIFGPLTGSGSDRPCGFTDDQALNDNLTEITLRINTVMSEGLQDVLDRIELDFALSGCDDYEVNNPYGSDLVFNTNQFISMYCAKNSDSVSSISLNDMEELLMKNKRKLYSMSYEDKTRTVTVSDPSVSDDESSEPVTKTITVRVYTIRYNGESYFSHEIFELTDEQKTLSDAYAANLSILLSDGVYQGLNGQEMGDSGITYDDIVFHEGATHVRYFNQLDARWADQLYGTDKIGGYACGPTSMSIVVSTLTSSIVEPPEMARWSYEHGYWCSGSGSYHSLIPAAAKAWNLTVNGCRAAEGQRIADALSEGKLVVALMSKGHFTNGGHYIVLRGVTADGKVLVADPASYKRSQREWPLELVLKEASKRATAGGPFWIIGRS